MALQSTELTTGAHGAEELTQLPKRVPRRQLAVILRCGYGSTGFAVRCPLLLTPLLTPEAHRGFRLVTSSIVLDLKRCTSRFADPRMRAMASNRRLSGLPSATNPATKSSTYYKDDDSPHAKMCTNYSHNKIIF